MRTPRVLLVAAALVLAACGGDSGTGPKQGDTTTTELTCAGSGGKTNCTIPISGKTSFTITVESTGCEAVGNILRIVSPEAMTLSDNACALAPGKSWDFTAPSGTFSTSAALNLSVTAKFFSAPPTLHVTTVEEGKKWRVVFEDGYDTDYNDVILIVTAA